MTFRLSDDLFHKERWVRSASSYTYDSSGNLIRSYIVAHDVTEQRLLADKLQASQEHLHRLLENIDVGVLIHSPDTRVIEANDRGCEILSLPRDQVIGKPATAAVWRFLREDGGDIRWGMVTACPHFDFSGSIEQIVVPFIDITRMKRIQEELRETVHTRGRFIDVIAHDLKSPMLAVETGVGLLIRAETQNRDETEETVIRELAINATRARELLDNLLDLSSVVDTACELFIADATRKRLRLSSTVGRGTMVRADRYLLESILRNLISNAIKFTPSEGTIAVDARDVGDAVEVSVADFGIGLEIVLPDAVRLGKSLVHTPETDGEKGTGLGLELCREFVERHDGEIRVQSRPAEEFNDLFPGQLRLDLPDL